MDNNTNKDNTDKKKIPSYEEFNEMIMKVRNKLIESIKNNSKHRRTKSMFDEFDMKVKNVNSDRKKIPKIKFDFKAGNYNCISTMRTTVGSSLTCRENSKRSKNNIKMIRKYNKSYFNDRLKELNKKLFAEGKRRNKYIDDFFIGWK